MSSGTPEPGLGRGRGHGRDAELPSEIPAAGWRDIAVRVFRNAAAGEVAVGELGMGRRGAYVADTLGRGGDDAGTPPPKPSSH